MIHDSVTKPGISAVITTYNRCDTVRKILEKFDAQTLPVDQFEVIVSDDGSTDHTPAMIEEVQRWVRYPLRHLRHENQGPGHTQNVGIKSARFEIVLLIADDIMPAPAMLAEHLKSHAEYPEENVAILGRVAQSPELPQDALHKVWDPFRYDRFEGRTELEPYHFLACNISIKRDFLLKHGLYRERKAIAHEDIELGCRLGQKGLRIIYNPEAFAHHYHVESLDRICQRAYERGYNFDLLSDHLPPEYIFPLYKILTVQAGWRPFLRMLPRECGRWALFNRWTVERFWRPVLQRADTNPLASLFATSMSYRGVAGYYLREGCRVKRRERTRQQKVQPS